MEEGIGQSLLLLCPCQDHFQATSLAPKSSLLQSRKHPWGYLALYKTKPNWLLGLAGPMSDFLHPFLKQPTASVFKE